MRILITGAAGNLGSACVRELTRAGHDVLATDVRRRDDLPVPVHAVNLLDRKALDALVDRCDALVHLGNHIDFSPPDTQMIFGDNMLMNVNAMQRAVETGAKKIVFASSIQAIASAPMLPHENTCRLPRYLPWDSEVPAEPTNPYALSKVCGEQMLEYYARVMGVQCVAMRWPWMPLAGNVEKLRQRFDSDYRWTLRLALACMSFEDAARLVRASLQTDLPGFRTYLPAWRENLLGLSPQEAIRQYFSQVPLRKPLEQIDALVDVSKITRETGWRPEK